MCPVPLISQFGLSVAVHRHVLWDEDNLEYNDANKSATMKIDEPDTPWASPRASSDGAVSCRHSWLAPSVWARAIWVSRRCVAASTASTQADLPRGGEADAEEDDSDTAPAGCIDMRDVVSAASTSAAPPVVRATPHPVDAGLPIFTRAAGISAMCVHGVEDAWAASPMGHAGFLSGGSKCRGRARGHPRGAIHGARVAAAAGEARLMADSGVGGTRGQGNSVR